MPNDVKLDFQSNTQQISGSIGPGYLCSCGTWVNQGGSHICFQQPQATWWQGWPTSSSVPSVQRFRGTVKSLDDLPKAGYRLQDAKAGDAYYVEKAAILVVRATNGWHHFDGD